MLKKITRITTQKKQKHRYNIFLSTPTGDEYGFSVDEDILIKFRLEKGMELDNQLIETLKEQDNLHKIYTLTIHFLSYRIRSEKEIVMYLQKKEVEDEQIPVIMQRLKKEKLLDDQQFADMFVRSRMNTSSKGPKIIEQELFEKGITGEIAANALEQYTPALQKEKIQKLLGKKIKQTSKDSFQKQINQAKNMILQKGFNQQLVFAAIQTMDQEENTDQEWEALKFQGEKLYQKHVKKYEGFQLKQKVMEGLYRKGFHFDKIQQFVNEYIENQE
ncbi:recombination regulator RecX [Oceanobacillus neutriphilus]|uniref:Regulatory protein RecX n=1 Tax=Oceanobacillus neutriphilus TaxID=531815 RepID=A0ABQ2P3F4_9BACI|nr:recombination regulator RecX [Oceanobacillus neutriphilus]GGP17021.1 regulatory protein RecX [Oceanobacillus neutriphilus]